MKISEMKKILDVLKDAYRIFEDENTWCQRTWARDKDGLPVDPTSSCATKWCISGLLKNLGRKYGREVSLNARIYLSSIVQAETNRIGIMTVNDLDGYEYVMRTLQTAISRLEDGINA